MENILVTICARGGSKGIPKKNIKLLNDFPLIYYSIKIAQDFLKNKKGVLALSSDDFEIKKVAKNFNLFSEYIRPNCLGTDEAGKIETIKDLVLFEEKNRDVTFDLILDLDVTSPLRNLKDLEDSYDLFRSNKQAQSLFSVSKANRNPYFNMVEQNSNGFYSVVKKIENKKIMTRQSAPTVFDLNASFYWYKRSFFENDYKSPISNNSLIYLMKHICFDLDHELDFLFMEYLIKNDKLDFLL